MISSRGENPRKTNTDEELKVEREAHRKFLEKKKAGKIEEILIGTGERTSEKVHCIHNDYEIGGHRRGKKGKRKGRQRGGRTNLVRKELPSVRNERMKGKGGLLNSSYEVKVLGQES